MSLVEYNLLSIGNAFLTEQNVDEDRDIENRAIWPSLSTSSKEFNIDLTWKSSQNVAATDRQVILEWNCPAVLSGLTNCSHVSQYCRQHGDPIQTDHNLHSVANSPSVLQNDSFSSFCSMNALLKFMTVIGFLLAWSIAQDDTSEADALTELCNTWRISSNLHDDWPDCDGATVCEGSDSRWKGIRCESNVVVEMFAFIFFLRSIIP